MDFGEPAPQPNEGPSMHDLVIEDMKARKQFGLDKYGTPLQAFNGRRPLKDMYEELLDATVYAKQKLAEDEFKFAQTTPGEFADGLMAWLDDVAEHLPGVHEAVANRLGAPPPYPSACPQCGSTEPLRTGEQCSSYAQPHRWHREARR